MICDAVVADVTSVFHALVVDDDDGAVVGYDDGDGVAFHPLAYHLMYAVAYVLTLI